MEVFNVKYIDYKLMGLWQLQDSSSAPADSQEPRREPNTPEDSVEYPPTDSVPPGPRNQSISELGEVDVSESSINGIGAMKFTDEEDCGFFGAKIGYLYPIMVAICARAIFQYRLHALYIASDSKSKPAQGANPESISPAEKIQQNDQRSQITTSIERRRIGC